MKIRVMLADDDQVFRQIIANYFLENCINIDVVGQAPNGQVLLELMELNVPDVVILDLEMPLADGKKITMNIKRKFPSVKPIILSNDYNKYFIPQLFLVGACGYLSRNSGLEEILTTVEKVYTEGFYFNEDISKEVFTSLLKSEKLEDMISTRILSDREIQVLQVICNGKIYKEAANELNISIDTVKFHIKSIYKKTQINSIAGLVKYAIKTGITTVT